MNRFLLSVLICLVFSGINAQNVRQVKVTDLSKIISEGHHPMLVNFWATWCKPCIEEIPYFQKMVDKYKSDSLELLLVSVDFKEAFPNTIAATANHRKFYYPIYWLNETNADYFCPIIDPKWSGACPATLFVNNGKSYRYFTEGQLQPAALENELKFIIAGHR